MPSETDTRVAPRSVSSLTVCRMWSMLRPSRSSFQTTTVSPGLLHQCSQPRPLIARAGHDVGERLSDIGLRKRLVLLVKCLRHGGDTGVTDAPPRSLSV